MISFVVIALLAAQDATPPPTTPPSGEAPVAHQVVVVGQPPASVDRVVCRTMVETGSRLGGTRVCHRQSEWEQERRRNQIDADHQTSGTQDYGYQSMPQPTAPPN
jgi:hypothetical protein